MVSDLIANYEQHVPLEHRQRFGQFFTDERVARFMATWVLASGAHRLYDPAFGLGAFYSAARAVNKVVSFEGSEIDARIFGFWNEHVRVEDLDVAHEDYLHAWGRKRQAIICNPPYMRFQKFLGREQVFREFRLHLRLGLSGYTNIASAFLVKSISELSAGGRLAYVMPLEFLNTGYGMVVKQQLLSRGRIHAIIRLDCEKDAFPDVTTSIGIILFENTAALGPTSCYVVRQLAGLEGLLDRPADNVMNQRELRPDEKWLKHFEPRPLLVDGDNLTSLSTYGAFSRGIATGANEFFVLRSSQVAALGLPVEEVVKCVTKSSQIRQPVFGDSDWDNLATLDAPVFLLDAKGHPSPRAEAYIRHGEQEGFDKRYLTRCRRPWYRLESRRPANLLFGVFSRDGYKVVRNYSRALNLTCFHGFHHNLFGAEFVDRLFLYLMSEAGRSIVRLNVRKYGDSLDKFEPNDLNNTLVPTANWFSRIPASETRHEIEGMALRGRLSARLEDTFGTLLPASYTRACGA